MYAVTAFSYVTIWDEFIEQHWHQSIKSTIFNAQLALIISCRFNEHFSWVYSKYLHDKILWFIFIIYV